MEALGVISRSVPSFLGAVGNGIDAYCHHKNAAAAAYSSSSCVGVGLRRVCRKTRNFAGLSSCDFRQNDHLDYYSSGGKITSAAGGGGGKKDKCVKKEKEYKATTKMIKKRLKMLDGLSRDLSMLSSHEMDFGFAAVPPPTDHPNNAFLDQVKAKMIAEAAVLLQGQLKQIMTEGKELKMRRKAEKIRLKMQTTTGCELSSSSSSESSDNDCGQVVDMNAQNLSKPVIENEYLALPGFLAEERVPTNSQPPIPEALSVFQSSATQQHNSTMGECVEIRSSGSPEQGCCSRTGNFSGGFAEYASSTGTKGLVAGVSSTKIEVCMGGKCKKSGAAALLGEFQRLVGIEGAVSGCKCMGKCRDGPNVRILNDPVKAATNPLCIGVGLEDVDMIVANFIGESSELGLYTAS